jgi:hypothetical protein
MSQHEFTDEQNQEIEKFRSTLLHNSLLMLGIGFLLMLMGHELPILPGWVTMLGASFFLILGIVNSYPLVNFRRVITTADDDINQIVTAMDNLQTAFSAGIIIVMIMSGLALIEILILLF